MDKGMRVRGDLTKQGWETSDFPILCETCMGDNPYVRMTREAYGSTCKVCERPMTVFRWKPGAKARFKCTVTCQACSKLKNTCQCCILDLQYGLPVEVRDKVLQQAAAAIPGGALALMGSGLGSGPPPTSDTNRMYAMQRAEAAMEAGGVVPYSGAAGVSPAAHEALLRLNRNRANYARNLPKLCSFFARGECTRGSECPFRHEMPRDKDDPLAKQNYKDRYYGTEDPVAAKLLGRMADKSGTGGGSGRNPDLAPEASDPTACTVWVGGVEDSEGAPAVTQEALRSALYSHGEIKSVFIVTGKGCAFVEFGSHEQAVTALRAHRSGLLIGPVSLRLDWAKKPAGGERLLGAAADPNAGLRPEPQRQQQQQIEGSSSSHSAAATATSSAGAPPPYYYPAYPQNPAYNPYAAAGAGGMGYGGVAPWASAMMMPSSSASSSAAAGANPPGGVSSAAHAASAQALGVSAAPATAASAAPGAPGSSPAHPPAAPFFPFGGYPGGGHSGPMLHGVGPPFYASSASAYPMFSPPPGPPGGPGPASAAAAACGPIVGMDGRRGGGSGPIRGGSGGQHSRDAAAHPYHAGSSSSSSRAMYPSQSPAQAGAST